MKGKIHNFRRNTFFSGEEFLARTGRRLDHILDRKQAFLMQKEYPFDHETLWG